jgi:hypothetical protein
MERRNSTPAQKHPSPRTPPRYDFLSGMQWNEGTLLGQEKPIADAIYTQTTVEILRFAQNACFLSGMR